MQTGPSRSYDLESVPALQLAVLIAVSVVATVGAWRLTQLSMPLDDAYIIFRYARNLAQGHGLVYNIGERVEGYTCFLWVVVLSAVMRLGGDPELWSRLLGALGYLATGWLTYLGARAARLRRAAAVAAAAMVLLNPAFALWSVSGMETAPFAALVALGLWLFLSGRSAVACGVVFALASITRPEGLAYVAGLAACAALSGRAGVRRTAILSAGFAALFVPYFVWRWSYYGFLLPNTFYDKVGGGWTRVWRGWRYTHQFLTAGGFGLCALAFAGLATARHRGVWPLYGLVALAAGGVLYEGGDVFPGGRFFIPMLSPLAVLAACGLHTLWSRRGVSLGLGKLAALAGAVLVLERSLAAIPQVRAEAIDMRNFERVWTVIGDRLEAVADPNDTVALVGIGAVGYRTGLPVIDMVGVTDTTIAHTAVPGVGAGWPGHERFNTAYVLSRKPRFILLGTEDGRHAAVPAVRDMWSNPIFRRDYEWVGFGFRRRSQTP